MVRRYRPNVLKMVSEPAIVTFHLKRACTRILVNDAGLTVYHSGISTSSRHRLSITVIRNVMKKAIYLSRSGADPYGPGGNHRSYQNIFELGEHFGHDAVLHLDYGIWRRSDRPFPLRLISHGTYKVAALLPGRIGRLFANFGRNPKAFVRNPGKLFLDTGYTPPDYSEYAFVRYYRKLLQQNPSITLCVVDDVGFDGIIKHNRKIGLKTVLCSHNLECFDYFVCAYSHPGGIRVIAAAFARELKTLAQCDKRLLPSKVETGLINGLGLPAAFYPYMPVGIVYERLRQIRSDRTADTIQKGVFLLMGSAGHYSTRESFLWFVDNARRNGLPANARITVVGGSTDTLLQDNEAIPGLDVKGWVEQDELNKLMRSVGAVLIPQRYGLGTLTRLSELSCAGIPFIMSRHPTYALNLPPGATVVDDVWQQWFDAIEHAAGQVILPGDILYDPWEKQQPRALTTYLSRSGEK